MGEKQPQSARRRPMVVPVLYGALLIALAAFGLGRAWEIFPSVLDRLDQAEQYSELVDSTRVAFAQAVQANAPYPRTIPGLPHSLTLYPILAERMAQQGDVTLRVLVRANGEVGDVRIVKSSGYAQLDAAALIGVGYWYYIPAMKDHQPVDCWINVLIRFRMRNPPVA